MKSRCLVFPLALLGALIGSSLLAPCAIAAGGETVLVFGVQRNGKFDGKLSHSLYEKLGKRGEPLAKESALGPGERLCDNNECRAQLCSREGSALSVSAKITDIPQGSQDVTVSIYSAEQQTVSDERTICSRCTPQQLVDAVSDMAASAISAYRSKKAAATQVADAAAQTAAAAGAAQTATDNAASQAAPGLVPKPTEAPVTAGNDDFFSRWPRNRKIAAGVLTGLFLGALLPTLALHVTDGSETSAIGCTSRATPSYCVLQNKPLYVTGYAISGALAVGLALTFLWPNPKPASAAPVQVAMEEK